MVVDLAAALLNPDNVTLEPLHVADQKVATLLVDLSSEIIPHLWELGSIEELKTEVITVSSLGFIIWQVALAMDFMQQDNPLAARDTLALLFVFLEQMAMDNGKIDVAVLLALIEDPPQGMFSNRAFSSIARQRAFAATTIQARRSEATKEKPTPPPSVDPQTKKKAKGRGKPKKPQEEDQE